MKLRTLFLFITMSMVQFVYSQFSIGIEGGMNLSNIKHTGFESGEIDYKPSINYFAGISAKYSFNSKISLNSDFNYSVKGFRKNRTKYTYLVFTPQAEYRINKFIGAGFGFYAGLKLDEEYKNRSNQWVSTKEQELIKSSDYGLIASVKVYYNNFFIKIAYEYGLNNIENEIYYAFSLQKDTLDIKKYNRNIQIGIGYLIDFNKK